MKGIPYIISYGKKARYLVGHSRGYKTKAAAKKAVARLKKKKGFHNPRLYKTRKNKKKKKKKKKK